MRNAGTRGSAARDGAPRILPALLFPLLGAGCLQSGSGSTPAGSRTEEWYRLLINGQPAGFSREVKEDFPDGSAATTVFQRLTVRRGAESVTMQVESQVSEDGRGGIVRFRLVQNMAENAETTEGEVRGDRLEIVARGLGNPRRSSIACEPGAVGPRRLENLLREKLLRPGDACTAVTFFPEKASFGKATATRGEEETVQLPGGARKLVRRTTRADILPGSEFVEWIDGEGTIWKSRLELPGMAIETLRSTAREALGGTKDPPPEIFYSTSVRPEPPLKDPAGLRSAVYRFTLKKGDFRSLGIESLFRCAGQELVREVSPSSRVIRISKVLPSRKVGRPVQPPAGAEDALAAGVFIQSDDPLIQEIARQAAGGETDAFETARRLESWVHGNVRFKDLKTAFASAKEVAQRREGDCTEHGVLLAALARASGIPARVVAGLVFYEGSFVGHLWTEVFIDGWVPLDGTRGRGEVGPDHIAIVASPLAGPSAADLFLDMIQVIGNLRIEVLEEIR